MGRILGTANDALRQSNDWKPLNEDWGEHNPWTWDNHLGFSVNSESRFRPAQPGFSYLSAAGERRRSWEHNDLLCFTSILCTDCTMFGLPLLGALTDCFIVKIIFTEPFKKPKPSSFLTFHHITTLNYNNRAAWYSKTLQWQYQSWHLPIFFFPLFSHLCFLYFVILSILGNVISIRCDTAKRPKYFISVKNMSSLHLKNIIQELLHSKQALAILILHTQTSKLYMCNMLCSLKTPSFSGIL